MTAIHRPGIRDLGQLTTRWPTGPDGLQLTVAPLVPEIQLHLAADAIVLRARMEAEAGAVLEAPFWASAWLGGQALARFILDHRDVVAGRRVLDLAAGSGIVAIAASLAGASAVTANDIDPWAIAAIQENAAANAVEITTSCATMLDQDIDEDVVLVGDVFYSQSMADLTLPLLERACARGATVLVGDPDRGYLYPTRMAMVATYSAAGVAQWEDSEREWVHVLRLTSS